MGESKHPSLQVLVYDDLTLEDLFHCAPTSSHSALVASYLTHNDRQKVDSLGVYADKTEGLCSNARKTDSQCIQIRQKGSATNNGRQTLSVYR